MNILDIQWIQQCVFHNNYLYSNHANQERQNDELLLQEVEQALLTGRILEQYDDTGRGESSLIVGFADAGKPVHVVCGRMDERMVIITVYVPSSPKFTTPFKRVH